MFDNINNIIQKIDLLDNVQKLSNICINHLDFSDRTII
jgi:hypothetical protein